HNKAQRLKGSKARRLKGAKAQRVVGARGLQPPGAVGGRAFSARRLSEGEPSGSPGPSASQPRSLAASQPCSLAASQPRSLAASQPPCSLAPRSPVVLLSVRSLLPPSYRLQHGHAERVELASDRQFRAFNKPS